MYRDTLDMDFSFDVPVHRSVLFSVTEFDVPVRPMDAKGLIKTYFKLINKLFFFGNTVQFSKQLKYFKFTNTISNANF